MEHRARRHVARRSRARCWSATSTATPPEQARRHEVRPGLTGLAQVSGRNQLSWEDKLRLDVEYVDTRSFAATSAILLATVRHVLRGTGVSADGEATMAEFRGTATHEDRG